MADYREQPRQGIARLLGGSGVWGNVAAESESERAVLVLVRTGGESLPARGRGIKEHIRSEGLAKPEPYTLHPTFSIASSLRRASLAFLAILALSLRF